MNIDIYEGIHDKDHRYNQVAWNPRQSQPIPVGSFWEVAVCAGSGVGNIVVHESQRSSQQWRAKPKEVDPGPVRIQPSFASIACRLEDGDQGVECDDENGKVCCFDTEEEEEAACLTKS